MIFIFRRTVKDEFGCIHPYTQVDPDAQPKFYRPRPVPFAIKAEVEDELDRLEAEGILEKVTHSEWAAPIVVVPKQDGKIRICGDFKVTIITGGSVSTAETRGLICGRKFTTLDLSQFNSRWTRNLPSIRPSIRTKGCIVIYACHSGWHLHRQSFKRPWTPYYKEFPMSSVMLRISS
jgi:hypothetical protein